MMEMTENSGDRFMMEHEPDPSERIPPGMVRYRLLIEYDGSGFCGWQRQKKGCKTVQGELEQSLERLCGHPVLVIGAGRTDSGVHALGQVAHFDTNQIRPPEVITRAINATTPPGLTILTTEMVGETFHSRFSARYREYRYRILARRERPALDRLRVWHHPQRLDEEVMKDAASLLLGAHDFSAFRSAACQAHSPIRTVSRMELRREGSELQLIMGANAFLQHMVRNVVGSLAKVGRDEWTIKDFWQVLLGRDRTKAAPTAPPQGLYLYRVEYGEQI